MIRSRGAQIGLARASLATTVCFGSIAPRNVCCRRSSRMPGFGRDLSVSPRVHLIALRSSAASQSCRMAMPLGTRRTIDAPNAPQPATSN